MYSDKHMGTSAMLMICVGTPYSGVGIVVELEAKYTRYPQYYVLEYSRNLDKYLSYPVLTSLQ